MLDIGRGAPVRLCDILPQKRTGGFRPDYVRSDRHRAQEQTFSLAPTPAIQLTATKSRKQTLLAAVGHSQIRTYKTSHSITAIPSIEK